MADKLKNKNKAKDKNTNKKSSSQKLSIIGFLKGKIKIAPDAFEDDLKKTIDY